jgi:hypothetical protein
MVSHGCTSIYTDKGKKLSVFEEHEEASKVKDFIRVHRCSSVANAVWFRLVRVSFDGNGEKRQH